MTTRAAGADPLPSSDHLRTPAASYEDGSHDKRTDPEVRTSEVRFRRLFESARDGILILDPETRKITEANPFMTELLGYRHGELLGKELWQIGLLKDEEASKETFHDLQANGYVRYDDLPLQSKTGEHRDVEFVSNIYEEGAKRVIQCNIRSIAERKQVADLLAESERRYRSTLDHMREGCQIIGTDWRYLYLNEAASIQNRRPNTEMMGRKFTDAWPGVEAYRIFALIRRCLNERIALSEETKFDFPDGSHGWFDVRCQPVPEGVFVLSIDITDRRRKDDALRLRERALAEISQGVLISDENQLITYVNAGFTAITGYDRQEIIGRNCSLVQGSGTDPGTILAISAAMDAGLPFDGEILNYRKDGTPFWNELSIAPINGHDGEPIRFIAIQRDITARKVADEALHRKTALFEALVESSLDGIKVVDLEGRQILQNQRVNDLWEIPAHLAASHDEAAILEFVTGQTKRPRQFAQKVIYLYAHPNETGCDEIELLSGKILDRYSAPIRDKAGIHHGRIWAFRDVTEERGREKKLSEALTYEKELSEKARCGQRAKSDFLATMSHEIRTPMNAILGFSEILADTPDLPEDCRDSVHTITSSGEALLNILNDVLDFSRQEANGMKIEASSFDPRDALSDVQTLLAPKAREGCLELHVSIGKGTPGHIWNDSGRLRQVLLNLVNNAIKFTEHGSVMMGVRMSGDSVNGRPAHIEFFVRDTGPGIPASKFDEIFEPFKQLDNGISRCHGGSGLGLSISRNLIKLMGGTLTLSSRLSKGSEFCVTLPNIGPESALAVQPKVPADVLDDTFAIRFPLRVLLVEDDAVNRKLMLMMLRRLGYEPLVANDGLEAEEIYNHGPLDCILMDLQMPKKNGFEATAAIRGIENIAAAGQHVFISALTANMVAEDRQRCFDEGMDGYLTKPIKRAVLANMLIKASDQLARRAQDNLFCANGGALHRPSEIKGYSGLVS